MLRRGKHYRRTAPTSAARPRADSAAARMSRDVATSTCAGPYATSFAASDALSAASWCAVVERRKLNLSTQFETFIMF